MFLGDELTDILEAIEEGASYTKKEKTEMEVGVKVLPHFPKDTTDRNRTSPFAFTGNKFEFRMCGSQQNLADPNMVLNTAVAEKLDEFATAMGPVDKSDLVSASMEWIKKTLTDHQRVIFNGNGYSD